MKPDHPVTFKPETAADAWLGLLAARGVEYLFANGGTDFAPVVEAYAKGQSLGWRLPEVVIVPHENMGVAMAHGYAMVTGRPQAMMVHVGVGTANALNGLINASRQNVPILFTAGRTPLTESGALPAARNNYIHWAQEHFDQGGMLREFVKWDYELRHAEQVETVIDRALAIAKSEPQGPVYVTLPREILASAFSNQISLQIRPSLPRPLRPPIPTPSRKRQSCSARAQMPLLITANGGRTVESSRAIAQFVEAFAIPTIHYRPRHLALSTEHPMHCGWDPHALLKEADLVLVVDCDVPWIPKEGGPRPEAKVVHIGPDPLFARYPLRGFRTDIALTGAVRADAGRAWRKDEKASRPAVESRRKTIEERSSQTRKKARGGVDPMPASHHRQVALGLHQQGARRRFAPGERVPDRARGDDDPRARPLLRQRLGRRPGLGHGRGARREARLARQDRGLRARRRLLHVRQPERRALRVRGDAPAGALHHRQQRALGGGAPLHALDLPEGPCFRDASNLPLPRSSPRPASSTSSRRAAATASASPSRRS